MWSISKGIYPVVVVITEEMILRMAAMRMIMELWVPLIVVVVVLLLFKFKCSTIGAAAVATSNGAVYDFAYDANDVTLGFEGNRSSHCESGYVVGL